MEYWQGMVVCWRKAMSHITHDQCLETHDLGLCGDCPHFMNILRAQEDEEWELAHREDEFRDLKSTRGKKGGDK